MYQVGQQVVYGAHGVCNILDMEDRVVDRRTISYFVLQPMENQATKYYVPAHNENALAKMRPLVEKEVLMQLLMSPHLQDDCWIPDENRRKQYYRQLAASIDLQALVQMILCLRRQKKKVLESGKKFHLCDENFLQDTQRVLSGELSLVLGIPKQELDGYLTSILGE